MINEKNCTYLYVGNVTNGYADNAADVDEFFNPHIFVDGAFAGYGHN